MTILEQLQKLLEQVYIGKRFIKELRTSLGNIIKRNGLRIMDKGKNEKTEGINTIVMKVNEAKKALVGKTLECNFEITEDGWQKLGVVVDVSKGSGGIIFVKKPDINGPLMGAILMYWASVEKLACNDYAHETIYNYDKGKYEFTTYRIKGS